MSTVEVVGKQIGSNLAVRFDARGGEVPLHLCVVVDVSGSMREAYKLDTVKVTLTEMVKMLKGSDRLSLVSFTDMGAVPLNSVPVVDNTPAIEASIASLTPMGNTNMEAGVKLFSTLTSTPDAVFLLTDGIINAGETSCTKLMEYIPAHLPVFTVGYGSDHNQILLQKMALRSNGMYSVAAAVLDVPDIVGAVLGSLRTMVVRRSELVVPDGWTVMEINHAGSSRVYPVGHMAADSTRWVCLKHSSATPPAASLKFVWMDSAGTKHTVEVVAEIFTEEDEVFAEQMDRCRASHAFAKMYMPLVEAKYADVLTQVNAFADELKTSKAAARPTNVALVTHLGTLATYLDAMHKRATPVVAPVVSAAPAPAPPILPSFLTSVAPSMAATAAGVSSLLASAAPSVAPSLVMSSRGLPYVSVGKDPRAEVVQAAVGTAMVTLCVQHGAIAPLDPAKVMTVTAAASAAVAAPTGNWLYSTYTQRATANGLTQSVTASMCPRA